MQMLIKQILREFVDKKNVKFLVIGKFVGNLNEDIDRKKKSEAWYQIRDYVSSISPFTGKYL